jgi:hypothetical protein
MKGDIDVLVSVLEEAHPFLHYFNPKEEWHKLIAETKQSIEDSLTQFGFYRKVAPIIANIHEEHTYIEPAQNLLIAHQLQKFILPFEIFIFENQAFIDFSHTNDALFPEEQNYFLLMETP